MTGDAPKMNQDGTADPDTKRTDAVILLLIVALAAFLRFYRLDYQSLWYDETYTASVTNPATVGLSYIWSSGPVAYMPPLHHTLVYLSRLVGTGEASLRFPSVLAGILTVILIYLTAKYCFNRRVAALASLTATVSSFHVYYSQEARAYSLLMLLSIASTYFLVRALREKRRAWWLLYVAASALGMYTHLFMAFVLLAQNVYLLMEWDSKRISGRAWLLSQAGTFLLFSPWLLTYAVFYKEVIVGEGGAFERLTRETWMPPPLWNLPFAVLGILFHGTAFELVTVTQATNAGPAWVTAASWLQEAVFRLLGPYLLFAAIAIWRLRNQSEARRYSILFGVLLLVPLMLMFAISFQTRILYPRYFTFAYPYYCILLALGMNAFKSRGVRMLMPAVLIAVNIISLTNYYFNPLHYRDPWREVATLLREGAVSTDTILVCCSEAQIALHYYYSGSPAVTGLAVPFRGTPNESWTYLQALMSGHTRAWLIVQIDWGLSAVYSDALREHCVSIDVPEVRRIAVSLYGSCAP
jgi:4-amino-4-deoxy-L-arabinose transferase-like glycosyltransferase